MVLSLSLRRITYYCVASLLAHFSSELKSDFGDIYGDTEVRLSPYLSG